MGHSFGGSVAVEIARQNNHFSAGINLDGWLAMKTTAISIPFLFLMNDSFFPPGKEEGMQEIQGTCKNSGASCAVEIIPGAGHDSFSDFGFLKWPFNTLGDPGRGDAYEIFKNINEKIFNFLGNKK